MPPRTKPHPLLQETTAHPDRKGGMPPVVASLLAACSLPVLALCATPASAQATGPDAPYFWDDADGGNQPEIDEARPEGDDARPAFRLPAPAEPDAIGFAADVVEYDTDAQIVTATGNVLLRRDEQEVRADAVTWDRQSGQITASGNVRIIDASGSVAYTDTVALTEELRTGAVENLLLVLTEGGRLAARQGERDADGQIILTDSAYSACAVETRDGCPKEPSWRITANRVVYNPDTQRVRFTGARLELFGLVALPLPAMSLLANDQPQSGVTSPNLRFSQSNGVEVSGGYYWRIAPNRELTLGASVFSDVLPMVSARYRAVTEDGAYQVTGYATKSSRIPIADSLVQTEEEAFRGYIDANGRYNLDEHWSVTGSLRVVTDRTFLRRYDISRDDRLRSMLSIERIDDDSYFSFTGWGSQTLRTGDDQGLVPFALPIVDYRQRVDDPLLGGRIMLHANSLLLARSDGQDTQRAFAGAEWSRRELTAWGQEIIATALVRGDVYHSDENSFTSIPEYRGEPGWQARGVAIGAIDVKWPLTGELFGGTQVLTPRVQLVVSPQIRNLAIPNEDARAVDLEDSNLFALNRFPGYDRIEDGVRFTYGLDWTWRAPGWRIATTVGQSYRLSDDDTLLPDGTGLTDPTSDIVGRTEVRWRDFIQFTHRFRMDKDELAFRRNEFDVAVGTRDTYVEAGYLKLDRDIPVLLEDLRDREELRLAARYAFADYWSVFGSSVINLTDQAEDPNQLSDGFEPLRTRLGVAYDDDCLAFSVTWRHDDFNFGDVERGSTFLFTFGLKNLGFR